MADLKTVEGRCLCGAVKVTATLKDPTLVACHCEMCRRSTGSMAISLVTGGGDTTAEGPIRTLRSSDWAERAFCQICGSRLWYSTVHDGARYLAAGLFEDTGHAALSAEYFVDQCPDAYALQGDHKRLTGQETIALFTDDSPAGDMQ
ncbi:MAG: GFA family protein [Roseobacter sp.]